MLFSSLPTLALAEILPAKRGGESRPEGGEREREMGHTSNSFETLCVCVSMCAYVCAWGVCEHATANNNLLFLEGDDKGWFVQGCGGEECFKRVQR